MTKTRTQCNLRALAYLIALHCIACSQSSVPQSNSSNASPQVATESQPAASPKNVTKVTVAVKDMGTRLNLL